jgi:hypothetical protein
MKNNVFKVTAGNKFQAVIVFLRSQLGIKASDPLVSPARRGAARCDVVWCDAVWCDAVWCGVV